MELDFRSKNIKNVSWIVHCWCAIINIYDNKVRSVKHLYKMKYWGFLCEKNRIKEIKKDMSYDFGDNKIKDISFIIDTIKDINSNYDGFYIMEYHKISNKYLNHLNI